MKNDICCEGWEQGRRVGSKEEEKGGGTINKFYAGVCKNGNVTIYDNKM